MNFHNTTKRRHHPVAVLLVLAACTSAHREPRPEVRRDPARELTLALDAFPGLGITLLPEDLGSTVPVSQAADARMASRDAALKDVMLTLFKDSGINLLIDDGVAGTATFDIKRVAPEAAFEALLRAYDLAYRWDGSFLHISRRDARTFDIDFPMPEAGAPGSGAAGAPAAPAPGGGTVGAAGAAGGAAGALGAAITSNTSVWERLESDLRALTQGQGSDQPRLIVNPNLGSVMVEARPSALRRVATYVATLRRRAARQVSIEARVLEVVLNDGFRAGVDFSLLPGFFNSRGTNHRGTLPGGAVVGTANQAGVDAFRVGFANVGQFSLLVDALEQQGQVRVLSSPRVSTLNNLTAQIRVVQQVPVIIRERIDSEVGTRTEFSVRFEEAGVAVDVTPQIGEDGVITCRVRPSITEVSGFVETPDNLIREPIFNRRSLTTTLRVRDGQPIVLGGLRGKRTTEELQKVPLLGDIPGLGMLFRKTNQTLEETELVILLMPRILTPEWEREELLRGVDRVIRLRRPYKATPLRHLSERVERWWQQFLTGVPRTAGEPARRGMVGAHPPSPAPRPASITRESLARLSFRRSLEALERGESEEAHRRLDETLALDPALAPAWLSRGVLAMRRGDLDRAAAALRECLRHAPRALEAQSNLGLVQLRAGNPAAAQGAFQRALGQRNAPEVRNNLGLSHMAIGAFDRAVTDFRAALQANPNLAEAHLNLAVCLERMGKREDAGRHYRGFLAAGGDLEDPRLRGLRDHVQVRARGE
ncbi:MAG: tetratricopeptide repeat protein [Planctomycetes bacterium]|nr:tetratricopeptide repeat protein [Planctomycetota bacterium]